MLLFLHLTVPGQGSEGAPGPWGHIFFNPCPKTDSRHYGDKHRSTLQLPNSTHSIDIDITIDEYFEAPKNWPIMYWKHHCSSIFNFFFYLWLYESLFLMIHWFELSLRFFVFAPHGGRKEFIFQGLIWSKWLEKKALSLLQRYRSIIKSWFDCHVVIGNYNCWNSWILKWAVLIKDILT